jgi:leucyl aminopeptidase (aminopeptidase T)
MNTLEDKNAVTGRAADRVTVSEQLERAETPREISSKIVNECLKVKPNEQVTILTWDHTLDYASSLALEVERASGIATIPLMSNDFYWSYLRGVPEEQFSRRQKGFLSLLDATDAIIQLAGPKDPSEYARIPAERSARMIDGQQAIADKMVEKKIRTITFPIGLVTRERARTYGFEYEHWHRMFTDSIKVDHSKITALGERLAEKIRNGKNARLTAANGTDLRFKLKGRPVHVRDGILDEADLAIGTQFETLPAGVLEHAPDEGSAEGVIRFDQPTALAGKMLTGLKWEFKNGRLAHYDAMMNLDSFEGLYENAEGDKDRLGSLAIGLNPRAEHIGIFTDRIVQGTVSIAIGGNNGIGGDNKTIFGSEGQLNKATLEIDGTKLIAEGRILQ